MNSSYIIEKARIGRKEFHIEFFPRLIWELAFMADQITGIM